MTSAAPRIPRRRRVLPAVVVAVVLGGLGATVATDVVAVQTENRSLIWPFLRIARDLRTAHWSQTPVVVTAAVGAAVGLLLVLLAVVPGRRKIVAVESGSADVVVGIPARSVRRALTSAARNVDGVGRAEVDYGRRRATVAVTSPLRDPGPLADDVRDALRARLRQFALQRPPEIRVRVRHRAASGSSSNLPAPAASSGGPSPSSVSSSSSSAASSSPSSAASSSSSSSASFSGASSSSSSGAASSSGGSSASASGAASSDTASPAAGTDLEGADR
jgi:hypothetical protein